MAGFEELGNRHDAFSDWGFVLLRSRSAPDKRRRDRGRLVLRPRSGIAIAISGSVGAASVSFLIHSRIVTDKLPQALGTHAKAGAIYNGAARTKLVALGDDNFAGQAFTSDAFAFTNFLMAAARVPLRSFIIGTFVGMLPRSSAVVFVGAGLSELSFDTAQDT